MKKSVSGAREQDIKNTIGKFVSALVKAREEFEGEQLSFEELMQMNTACSTIIRKFVSVDPKDRFFFHYKWEHINQGRDYGFGYLAHYLCELFKELSSKRWDPKSKNNMSHVMKMAHSIKKQSGKELGVAMTKAYQKIERTGSLRTDSIQQECRTISETCSLGLWNSIMPSYPCLNKGMNGADDMGRPKAKAIQIIADLLGPICTMIGYK